MIPVRSMVLSLMSMRFLFCATTLCLLGVRAVCLATTAADLCPAGTGPCVVARAIRVDDNSVIDTGGRHLLIATGGSLLVDSGTMTLKSDRLTVENGGSLRALGTASAPGGTINATANVIAIVGFVEVSGAPAGEVILSSSGDLTVTGTIEASSRNRDEDGGSIVLQGVTVTLAGPVLAKGGSDGVGGDIDVTSDGDLLVSRNVETSGGDSGTIDMVAGDSGAGNLTISQSGRLESNAIVEDGTAESISLEATGDGLASGHLIMNGLIKVAGLSKGSSAGDITIDVDGDVRGTDPTSNIIASGGRETGAAGDITITSTHGQYNCVAPIEARGSTMAAGGSLAIDVGGNIILTAPIDVRGGTVGGTIVARAGADISVETTLRTDSGEDGGPSTTLEGCTIVIDPEAVLSSIGPNGANRLTGRDLTVVRGTMVANTRNGLNEIVYGEARRRPVIFDSAQVIPAAIETEDSRVPPCGPLPSLSPTRTPTPTRQPRTPTPTPTRTSRVRCVGDCDGSGTVVVNELVLGVNIALSRQPLNQCPAFDPNGSGTASVDELVRGVNNLLRGCSQ